ncbi:MAG TPA: Rieske 2Fe-2S domain-containing protein [Streptosporangiaceae bacterium]|jgi:ubiquinol-cytochrome c reductase iron-sulfur subunit|nr:Rieske 2Fe-2S domain-containing protein [Streptosporangiaceae bacterium]
MSGNDNDKDQENTPTEPTAPRRVIGTPPPSRGLLADLGRAGGGDGGTGTAPYSPGEAEAPELDELPANPPSLLRAKQFERLAAAMFLLSMIASIAFWAAYIGLEVQGPGNALDRTLRSNLALGGSLSVVFLALAVGFTIWVRHIMPPAELVEERHPMASPPEDRKAFEETFVQGAETSQITKRPLLRRTLIAAAVPAAVAPIVLLRDMGPLPGTSLRHTVWRKGTRLLLGDSNRPITAAEFSTNGGMITVVPEGYEDNQDELAKATAIIIKFAPGELQIPTRYNDGVNGPRTLLNSMNWTVDNIVAYSKICTHVGCPAALYEQTTHRILCPCHQSTFQADRGAQVIFGPAPRPLPQLPITTDSKGYLVAASDFQEPVGPSFWERG